MSPPSAPSEPNGGRAADDIDGVGPAAESFEQVDLTSGDDGLPRPALNVLSFVAGLAVLVAGFARNHLGGEPAPLVGVLQPLDWLFAASLLAIVAFVVVPLAARPDRTRIYWRRLRRHPLGLLSFGVVVAFVLVGLVGPLFVTYPDASFDRVYQPPFGTTVDVKYLFTAGDCVGSIADGQCRGTLAHPFGTTNTGEGLLPLLVLGTRTSLVVAVVSATLIVPTGVGVGLLAAYAGGRTDRVLMQVAEVMQTVPAVFLYLLFWGWNAEYRLLVLVTVFGLTSWGGLARLVRNEALEIRERPYVKAALATGAGRFQVMRQHLLPNVSRSVLTNVTLTIPLLVFTEAALSFIVLPSPFDGELVSLGDDTVVSWGGIISSGVGHTTLEPGWWVVLVPGGALALTMLAFNVFGRTLGDVLDPRSG